MMLRLEKTGFKKVFLMVMAMLLSITVMLPAGAAEAAYTYEGPLSQDASWQSSTGGRNMYTSATLQRSGPAAGHLDVITRTKNNVLMTGFTGAVFILLRNSDGMVIGVTDQHKFGVDGKWIGRYDRTDYWTHSFDPQVAAATAYMEIIQQHSAKELDDQIASLQRIVCGNLDLLGLPKPPYGCPA
ncbi:hypothetical protein [Paenibacillus vietnamensis]|uniref:hypothetical protein n=1 Tax=Paenibacillus vietnamensis TaxID=2590547 RepID=UPI001CD172BD|nr:hypothetical protein [Paenibacillus vietnamensis]